MQARVSSSPKCTLLGLRRVFSPTRRAVDDLRELSEERRVFFVAMTRAQDKLTLTHATSRMSRGQAAPMVRSRFLDDLPSDHMEVYDPSTPATHESVKSHLARMRQMLRLTPLTTRCVLAQRSRMKDPHAIIDGVTGVNHYSVAFADARE